MISKVKPIPLFYLVLLLSYRAVTSFKMAASIKAKPLSKDSLDNLRQGSHDVAPPLRNNFLYSFGQDFLVVATASGKSSVDNLRQDSRVLEERNDEFMKLEDIVKTVAKTFKSKGTNGYVKQGILSKSEQPILWAIHNSHSPEKATEYFRLEVMESLKTADLNLEPFKKWFKGIETGLPNLPEVAHVIAAVVLSKELGNWDAARVLAKCSTTHFVDSQKIKKALFEYWLFEKVMLLDLLSDVNWQQNFLEVIRTISDPAFSLFYNYANVLEENEEAVVYDSFMEVLEMYNLDEQIPFGLPVFIKYMEGKYIRENPNFILERIVLPLKKVAINYAYDQFSSIFKEKKDFSKLAEELVKQLTNPGDDFKLFVVMHEAAFGDSPPEFSVEVMKQLLYRWKESDRSSSLAVELFGVLLSKRLFTDVDESFQRLPGLEIWKDFLSLIYHDKIDTPERILEHILGQATIDVTQNMLQEAWNAAPNFKKNSILLQSIGTL